MATRYAVFQAVSRVTSLELSASVGHSAAVVSPGPGETSLTVVSYDDTSANALSDLQAEMTSLGFTFIVDSASPPGSVTQTRDYGALAAAPTVPTPAQGYKYYNTTGKFWATHNGTDWIPEATPGLTQALSESGGNVAWDCSVYPRASITLTATGWTLVPSNMVVNGRYTLVVTQNGTGGYDLIFPSTTLLCRGPALGANAITIYEFTCTSAGVLRLDVSLGWRIKDVTGTTYTLTRQDYQTTLRFTNAAAVAFTGITIVGLENFEFEALQYGAGQVTFTPAGGELIYWDPGATSGSADWATLPQFNTQRIMTDGSTGWFMR